MFINFLLTIFLLYLCIHYWEKRKHYIFTWRTNNGVFGIPIIGSAYVFYNPNEIIRMISEYVRRIKTPCTFWLATQLVVFFDKPEDIGAIMQSKHSADKAQMYQVLTYCMGGKGLFTSEGQEWKIHRKLLNPVIQSTKLLNSFYPIFNNHLRVLIKKLENQTQPEGCYIYKFVEACAFDMICETTFDTNVNTQNNENIGFMKGTSTICFIVAKMILQPWLQMPFMLRFSKYYKMLEESRSIARVFITQVVDDKIKSYKEMKNTDVNFNRDKMIYRLINLWEENQFTYEDIIQESANIMAGGFETTATTIYSIVILLAMYPEYQERVFEEIQSVFPEQDSDVTSEEIAKLEYTDRFIKESMRLIPTVPLIAKRAHKELTIGSHVIPAGSELGIGVFQLHRNKDVWGSDADKFNPDNFLPEKVSQRHPYAFIPYSGGIRNCIGLKYANISLRIFVCWLVRNYRFSTDAKFENLKFRTDITIRLVEKVNVRIHKRDNYDKF